ncbi:MAG: Ku protein [Candidatus Hadarchaeales archaeon]
MAEKFSVTFGLVSVPVKLHPAVKEEHVSFNWMTRDGHRVRQKLVDEVTQQEVDRNTLLKGYKIDKDRYITFEQDEVSRLKLKTTKTIELVGFIPATSPIDPVLSKEELYLEPDKHGEKGYSILLNVLMELNARAVGRMVRNGKEYTVLLTPWNGILRLTVLYYPSEIQKPPVVELVPITEKEKELGKMLIEALGQPDLKSFKDRYREALKELIQAKLEGRQIEEVKVEITPEADITSALARSLEAMKKKKLAVAAQASQ